MGMRLCKFTANKGGVIYVPYFVSMVWTENNARSLELFSEEADVFRTTKKNIIAIKFHGTSRVRFLL